MILVPDGVASSESDPLRDRAVLLLRPRKLLLGAESLVALGVGNEPSAWCPVSSPNTFNLASPPGTHPAARKGFQLVRDGNLGALVLFQSGAIYIPAF